MPQNYDTYNPFEEAQPRRRRYAQTYGQSPLASTGDTGIPDPGTTDIGIPGVDPWSEQTPDLPSPYADPASSSLGVPAVDTDPVRSAVLSAYQTKGVAPRDDADLNYWINKINTSGGFGNEQNKAYWLDRMGMQYGGVGDYTESGRVGNPGDYRVEPGYGYGGESAPSATATTSAAAAPSISAPASDPGFDAAIKAMILKLLQGGSSDPYADPVNQAAQSAYNAQESRNADEMRNAIGERAAVEGTTGTGGYTNQLLGAEQTAGENKANFAATLATRTLERQRSELMSALSLGAGVMSAEQQRALTAKIAEIDAAIRQQSVTNQNNQFNQNLGWSQDQWTWLQNLLPYMQGN